MQIKFDTIQVPKERLDETVRESMEVIHKQYKIRRRRSILTKSLTAAAAVLLAAGICFSNPVLAAKLPLIGHIFGQVQEKQRYPGNFDEVSKPVQEKNESISGGVTVTLSEVYADTEAMYVSAIVKSEEPFPKKLKESNMLEGDNIGYHLFLEIEQDFDFLEPPAEYEAWEQPGEELSWEPIDVEGEYVDDYTYIRTFRTDFNLYPFGKESLPDNFHWKLKVNKIHCYEYYSKQGTWEFETDVAVDKESTKTIEINESAPNGEVITSVTVTPYEVIMDYDFDESKVQPGYERGDSIQSVMVDAAGKQIHDKAGMFSAKRYDLSKIIVYYFKIDTDEAYMSIQERIRKEEEKGTLPTYLEEIAVHKIEMHLAE